ncbi:Paxillin [Carabus blaptoides fortunei]
MKSENSNHDLCDLDALLADLQNTVSPTHSGSSVGGATAGYGSLNGVRHRASPTQQAQYAQTRDVHSPTYQNQKIVQETISKSTSYPVHGGYGSGYIPQSPTEKYTSLNNNLSELDTLLQDLSNARYANTMERKEATSVNGTTSPNYATARSASANSTLNRPSVDSLLAELNTDATNGEMIYAGPRQVTITVKETKTETTGIPVPNEISSHATDSYSSTTRIGGPAASSATKELDDLMASLSDFKINASSHQHQTVTDSPYAKPNKATKSSPSPQPIHGYSSTSTTNTTVVKQQNQLDSMLGNLQADMSRQGVNTTQKGCCNACEKPIVGQVITALGKTWHPEHFVCTHCTQELGTRNFFERDGHPYCEPDYHNLFSPRCAYCNGPILDKCVTALEKTWHTEHFFCAQCGKQFGEEGFHEREGKPYCRDDYFDMFAPKCGGCNRAIMENYISALNNQWHADCFVCRECHQPFHGGSFFDHDGQPYCETHYHAKRGSLCAGCHKPITGRCITAMFRKFHPEHFVCAFCLKQLNKGTFKEQNDKPYCHGCFEKLFGYK